VTLTRGQQNLANSEGFGPWTTDSGNKMCFERLALGAEEAVAELQELLGVS